MAKIRKNDEVVVIAGRDRGSVGTVLRVLNGGERLVVKNVNMIKRHQRPTQAFPQGGIIEKEATIDASNVMLKSPSTDKGFRVGYKMVTGDDGQARKVRCNPKTGEVFDSK